MLLSRIRKLAYFLHRGWKWKLRGCKASAGKGLCNLNFRRVDIINMCSLLVNALWARGLHLTLQTHSKPTTKQRKSQKTTFGKIKILRKNCHVPCEESFLWEVAAPQRARLDVPVDSKYCDRFHNCSCQRKHKAKIKKYFNHFFSFYHKKRSIKKPPQRCYFSPSDLPFLWPLASSSSSANESQFCSHLPHCMPPSPFAYGFSVGANVQDPPPIYTHTFVC